METTSKSTLTSSDDEEKQDCMPKILNTISLHGCSDALSFQDDQDDPTSFLYPTCELSEENTTTNHNDNESKIGISVKTKNGEKISGKEKKRLKLTSLSPVKHRGIKSWPSTSKDDPYNVVDARKLALQESLFKTKELFDTFLRVSQDQENSEEMERVVTKLGRAYSNARLEFLGSLAFQNILEAETEKVNTSNTKPWLNLKLVLDEMKHNKVMNTPKLKLGESEESQDGREGNDEEPIIECPKTRRHLKKLEKTLRQINLKIKKLEEREVDLEDDNSAYIKLDRYRDQFIKIYTKICEKKGKLPDADRPYLRKVSFAGTTYPHINRCIERYYNKYRDFPDFQDIKKLVIQANKQENIEMAPVKVHQMAASAFKEFGEMLKRLRQYDDYDVIISYLDQQVDPARDNEELQEELAKNAMLFRKKEQEVIDQFAAEDAGLYSGSGGVDSKPKNKKPKIIITSPKKKLPLTSTPLKKYLSSNEDSDEEEEKQKKPVKKKTPIPSLSNSDSSNNDSDSEVFVKKKPKITKSPAGDKGKTIIGKDRIVKRGIKLGTSKKVQKPRATIDSSDEESSPKDTKATLTNYLGLQVTPTKTETKEVKVKEESDEDEITCIKEIQKPPVENNIKKNNHVKKSSDSDESSSKSDVSLFSEETDIKSELSSFNTRQNSREMNNADKTDSSSSESIGIVKEINKVVESNSRTERIKQQNRTRVLRKKPANSRKKSKSDSSSDSDNDRTSVESVKSDNKSLRQVEQNERANSLSSDSSDNEEKKDDDAIVILSEDIIEVKEPNVNGTEPKKLSDDGSDSDDICILSQESTETSRQIAPRKIKPQEKPTLQTLYKPKSNSSRRPGPTSSMLKTYLKRRGSSGSDSGRNIKKTRKNGPLNNSMNGTKQTTIPQTINGAMRKTIAPRVCDPPSSPESIPLIELD